MNEDVKFVIESTKELMQGSIKHLEHELTNIRAGKASPIMLKSVMVDYYGASTPLSQVANVNTLDAHTITVQPWEKSLIHEIEKGIMSANLGFNPMNNGESVIINVPILTEERRRELAKQAKAATEDAKVSIRNDRKEANSELKKMEISEDLLKNAEIDIQELTQKYSKIADEHYAIKEKEIMKV
ncbi:MAG: ribosome recycling factor [Bacteroidetes bacterium]|nr:MAG: ribosome recycling factor [Bacteroidota bacterium]